jgi:hypothetical protein
LGTAATSWRKPFGIPPDLFVVPLSALLSALDLSAARVLGLLGLELHLTDEIAEGGFHVLVERSQSIRVRLAVCRVGETRELAIRCQHIGQTEDLANLVGLEIGLSHHGRTSASVLPQE